jgi:hypothetical protein
MSIKELKHNPSNILSIFFISIIFISSYCSNEKCQGWKYGEEVYNVNSIQITSDNGFIIAGDGCPLQYNGNESYCNIIDIQVMKLDAKGLIQWEQKYSSPEAFVDAFMKVTSIIPVQGGGYVLGGEKGFDFLFLEIDNSGNVVSEKSFGTNGNLRHLCSFEQTDDGGFIAAGIASRKSTKGETRSYYWVFKIGSSGDLIWEKSLGDFDWMTSADYCSVKQTADKGYLLAGNLSDDVWKPFDIWIAKLDNEGTVQWEKTLGSPERYEKFFSMDKTSDGGYIIAGETKKIKDPKSTESVNTDAYIIKISGSGNIEWERSFGGTGNDSANDIKATSDGGYIVAWAYFQHDYFSIVPYKWIFKLD